MRAERAWGTHLGLLTSAFFLSLSPTLTWTWAGSPGIRFFWQLEFSQAGTFWDEGHPRGASRNRASVCPDLLRPR